MFDLRIQIDNDNSICFFSDRFSFFSKRDNNNNSNAESERKEKPTKQASKEKEKTFYISICQKKKIGSHYVFSVCGYPCPIAMKKEKYYL